MYDALELDNLFRKMLAIPPPNFKSQTPPSLMFKGIATC